MRPRHRALERLKTKSGLRRRLTMAMDANSFNQLHDALQLARQSQRHFADLGHLTECA